MTDHAALAKLRAPFGPESINKLPRVTCGDCSKKNCNQHKRAKCNACGAYISTAHIHLDFVGHAALTARLLDVDPEWTWEPFATDEHGGPLLERDRNGNPVGLWINLTVAGMTRPGYGSVEGGKGEAVKELIGDALRNAGMRFGCALDLWHKGDLPEPEVPAEPVDLSALDALIAECREVGVDGDYDTLRSWAAESVDNATKACDKLRKALANKSQDPPTERDGGEATPPVGDQPAADVLPSSDGSARDGSPPSAAPSGDEAASNGGPPSTAVPSPDHPFDWEDYCREKKVTKVALMNALRAEWSRFVSGVDEADSKRLAPNKSSEIGEWAGKYPLLVKAIVDDAARKAAA